MVIVVDEPISKITSSVEVGCAFEILESSLFLILDPYGFLLGLYWMAAPDNFFIFDICNDF
jgi:hypothetical protein